ncbi:MAG: ATP-dependent RNA helicase HrpA [Magnetococcales bacterium]|nr:ATP-dependent RNA helicase HrpA [Magnetococcales bacterium]
MDAGPDVSSLRQRLIALGQALPETLIRDRRVLDSRFRLLESAWYRRRLEESTLCALEGAVAHSRAQVLRRKALVPPLTFDEALPVSAIREEFTRLLNDHPVVILCGSTGSGKTTQTPKICLQAERGVHGRIGITQPRRLAARGISSYLAAETRTALGSLVGCKIRFADQTSADTLVKVMTDGILLTEIHQDPLLEEYDTLVVDEAHERSLNIDFLLGYLQRILPLRPDLRLIISSATLEVDKFSRHFRQAPILEAQGRVHPVEIRYRPWESSRDETPDLEQAVVNAVNELHAEGGDILVFLPGEREIRDTAEVLRRQASRDLEILPLFARLSAGRQEAIFHPRGQPRVILATNVAETSLTVPGIRHVIDSGLARVSRFSGRTQVQRLPVEDVSQASANQRSGRCGRLAPGVCIRLFSQESYLNRPPFTDPEILRTSLASVILRMKALELGDVEEFPFIDAPSSRAIGSGMRLLEMLQALDADGNLTPLGREMALLPLDVRLARILLAGRDGGCLSEMLVLVTALSVQDPRERPQAGPQRLPEVHKPFADAESDFSGWLKLWNHLQELKHGAPSGNQFRQRLKAEELSVLRVQEWFDLHRQLKDLVREEGQEVNRVAAPYITLHKALLRGFVDLVGQKGEEREFQGTHQQRFHLFPGSGLHAKPPSWVMCAEMVETSRLYARCCARIQPEWLEETAPHLLRRSYRDPHWEADRGCVVALERVTLLGLVIVPGRSVRYDPIDAVESRLIFVREALAAGQMRLSASLHGGPKDFLSHNQRLIRELTELEARARRRDILVAPEALESFFEERLPPGIATRKELETWLHSQSVGQARRLFLDQAFLMRHAAQDVTRLFPGSLEAGAFSLPLTYRFEPGSGSDGIHVTLPVALLNQVPEELFDWLVPGLLEEKLLHLLKGLPQSVRRLLVPLPALARDCAEVMRFGEGNLHIALAQTVHVLKEVPVEPALFQAVDLPDHLRMMLVVVDGSGRQVEAQRDLKSLRSRLAKEASQSFQESFKAPEESGALHRQWTFPPLPESCERKGPKGIALTGYPALQAEAEGVRQVILDSPESARACHRSGLVKLFRLQLAAMIKDLERRLTPPPALGLAFRPYGSIPVLVNALLDALVEEVFLGEEPIRSGETFLKHLDSGRTKLFAEAQRQGERLRKLLTDLQNLAKMVNEPGNRPLPHPFREEILGHMKGLLRPDFPFTTPLPWRHELARYVEAGRIRVDRYRNDPAKDSRKAASLAPFLQELAQLEKRPEAADPQGEVAQLRWMIEEYRVSLFAQELGTRLVVSEARLQKQVARAKQGTTAPTPTKNPGKANSSRVV